MDEAKQKVETAITEVTVIKSDLKKVLSAHKRFAIFGKNVEGSVLSAIKFEVKDDVLILTTTDGNRALQTELTILTSLGEDCEFYVSMALASKLSFVKGELNEIIIHYENGKVEFIDEEFNSNQILRTKDADEGCKFPDVNKCIPTKNNFTITVSQKLIKDIAALKAPKGYVDLSFNTKDKLAVILCETNSEEVTQKAILAPIKKDADKEK